MKNLLCKNKAKMLATGEIASGNVPFLWIIFSNVYFSHVLSEVLRLAAWEEAACGSTSDYKKSEPRPGTSRQREKFPAKQRILQSKLTAGFLLIWHQRISMTRADANFMCKHEKHS